MNRYRVQFVFRGQTHFGIVRRSQDDGHLVIADAVYPRHYEVKDDANVIDIPLGLPKIDALLAPHEVVFFKATPPGDEPRPFGLAAYPWHMEGSNKVVPAHLVGWQWIGVIRSSDMQAIQHFIHGAVQLGLEVTATVGGKVVTAKLDETGHVRFEERTGFPF